MYCLGSSVCVHMYVSACSHCVCIYVHVYTSVDTHVSKCPYARVCTRVFVWVQSYVCCECACICVCLCMHIYAHASRVHTSVHACACVCVCMCAHGCDSHASARCGGPSQALQAVTPRCSRAVRRRLSAPSPGKAGGSLWQAPAARTKQGRKPSARGEGRGRFLSSRFWELRAQLLVSREPWSSLGPHVSATKTLISAGAQRALKI